MNFKQFSKIIYAVAKMCDSSKLQELLIVYTQAH